MTRFGSFAFCAALVLGCGDSDPPQPCSSDGQCLPGFHCVTQICVACEPGACSADDPIGVGPEGGTICGVDQVCVDVPAGALADRVELAVTRAGMVSGAWVRSAGYRVEPVDTAFAAAVKVRIPLTGASSTAVHRGQALDGPWTKLPGASTRAEAVGETTRLGLFVAGD